MSYEAISIGSPRIAGSSSRHERPELIPHIPFAETKIDGLRFRYALMGRGPTVVFVHGFTLDARVWAPQLQAFSKKHQVLIYDQRGHGRSAALTSDAPHRSHGEDLLALLDHLELSRVALVGSSMGGKTALELALEHPERVRELVLASPYLDGWKPSRQMAGVFRRVRTAMGRSGEAAAKEAWASSPFFRLALSREHGPLLERVLDESVPEHWHKPPPPKSSTMIERLPEIRARTLILAGEIDVEDFHQMAAVLARSVPSSECRELPRVGHLPNLEATELFNRITLDFLGGRSRRSQPASSRSTFINNHHGCGGRAALRAVHPLLF